MTGLVRFWRQRGKRDKTLLAVVAVGPVIAVVAVIAAIGGRDMKTTVSSQTAATTEVAGANAPIRCLNAAGLSDVKEEEANLWRGSHIGTPYAIVVHKLATPVRAPKVVAGTYAVTGEFKVAAEGTDLTITEGLEADALVQEVADCLEG